MELRMVEYIERLETELRFDPLADLGVLKQRQVPIVEARPAQPTDRIVDI